MNTLSKTVGRNIRQLREKHGLSQTKLAGMVGVNQSMISRVESAKAAPSIKLLERLSEALDVAFARLLLTESDFRWLDEQPGRRWEGKEDKLQTGTNSMSDEIEQFVWGMRNDLREQSEEPP